MESCKIEEFLDFGTEAGLCMPALKNSCTAKHHDEGEYRILYPTRT